MTDTTTDQQHDLPAAPTGDPVIINILRDLHAGAMADADRLAGIGGHEREKAAEHLRAADAADQAAMAARAYAERWRRHLDMELAGRPDLAGVVEPPTEPTVPVRRAPYGPMS
ncbi:hypothetical protein ABZW11_16995 [Nonomuraea sp. NPDC004580]|uniref:hypothetical protein n=1 Tax=Nonomuraea sp. NPDC004580 TaxID=3154552 RepID=UPI0033A6D065